MRHFWPDRTLHYRTRDTAARRTGRCGLAAIVLAVLAGWPAAAGAAVSRDVGTLKWLSGCWRMESGETLVEEYWMEPSGDAMLGMSRTIRNGSLVGYELLLIIETESGLIYRAHPSGQAMANFTATEASARGAVFENETHDFPRRIAYWPTKDNGLSARVDDGSDVQSYELAYRRIDCPTT